MNIQRKSLFDKSTEYDFKAVWTFRAAMHNPRHVKPKTCKTPDTSNPRHIKPMTHKTSDNECRAANYTTNKNTFSYFN